MQQPDELDGAARPPGDLAARPESYAEVARAMAREELDDGWLRDLLTPIEQRLDLADHKLLVVLAFLLNCPDELDPQLRDEMQSAVLGFRYWMDEPGCDSMCHWSESHQLLFSVAEHLAGQLYPDQTFGNDGRKGRRKAERGRDRLLEWLGNRFRYGFSEWLSHTYYELDVAGLTLLVEHSSDDELVTRASMVLDLLMLDMALHRFEGRFIASAGRAKEVQKARPDRAEVNTILASAFGGWPGPRGGVRPVFDPAQLSSIFLARRRYAVPQVIQEISRASADHLVVSSTGLDAAEVPWEVGRRRGLSEQQRRDALVNLFWSMESFTNPESIGPTLAGMRRFGLQRNGFLAPLAPFLRLHSPRAAAAIVRSLNPISQGTAMQRANVQTYRTPHYLLTSAQRYQPGSFGDQEHIWQAALPGDITVFSTHPGSTLLNDSDRPRTPSAWVGNGINPDVAQDRTVLLALHDLRARRGYLEGRRHELSHLYFPSVQFDETRIGEDFVVGRRLDSYIAAVALNPIEMASEVEIVQRGRITAWAVLVADRSDFGSLGRLVEHLKRCRLSHGREGLVWRTPEHVYRLEWGGPFEVDGRPHDSFYPRLHCDWAHVPRHPSVIQLGGRTGSLLLDWKLGERCEGPPAKPDGRPLGTESRAESR